MSCQSSLSFRAPSLAWRRCGVPSLGGACWGGVCSSPSPVVGFECHTEVNAATCASNGAIVQTMMASSCNSITSIKVLLAQFKSSIVPKRMTDSATKYQSTPNGCVMEWISLELNIYITIRFLFCSIIQN